MGGGALSAAALRHGTACSCRFQLAAGAVSCDSVQMSSIAGRPTRRAEIAASREDDGIRRRMLVIIRRFAIVLLEYADESRPAMAR